MWIIPHSCSATVWPPIVCICKTWPRLCQDTDYTDAPTTCVDKETMGDLCSEQRWVRNVWLSFSRIWDAYIRLSACPNCVWVYTVLTSSFRAAKTNVGECENSIECRICCCQWFRRTRSVLVLTPALVHYSRSLSILRWLPTYPSAWLTLWISYYLWRAYAHDSKIL